METKIKKIQGTLKIKKTLWMDILKGEKRYEYRKLSKGLTTGYYKMTDTSGNELGVMYLTPIQIHSLENPVFSEAHKRTSDFVRGNYCKKHDFVKYSIMNAYPLCKAYKQEEIDLIDCCDYCNVNLIDCCDYCNVQLEDAYERAEEYDAHISTV